MTSSTMDLRVLLVVLHVIANLVWIGSIAAVALVLSGGRGDSKLRGEIGLDLYRKLAVPAFVASFAAGLIRLLLDTQLYLVLTKYMHPKLTLALVVIALHHVIGARAKRMASGTRTEPGPAGVFAAALVACAAGAALLALVKPF
jgi:protoporphyrinogen IX oxidase